MSTENRKPRRIPNVIFPLVLIVIGLVFLLRNLGVLTGDVYQTLVSLWPILLIILGIDSLVREKSIGGPVFLIGLGTIFLLANFGLVGAGVWSIVLKLWPILIVAFGVDILLGEKNLVLAAIGVILVLAILFGALWLTGLRLDAPGANLSGVEVSYSLEGINSGEVYLEPAVGSLYLGESSSKDAYLEGTIQALKGEQVKEDFTVATGKASLRLKSTGLMFWAPGIGGDAATWALSLNPAIPTDLTASLGVGEIELDLADLLVEALIVDHGVGDIQISLPEAGMAEGKINLAIGRITLEVPPGVGLRIDTNTALANVQAPEAYTKEGGLYSSPNFETAKVKIRLTASIAIGSLVIIQQ